MLAEEGSTTEESTTTAESDDGAAAEAEVGPHAAVLKTLDFECGAHYPYGNVPRIVFSVRRAARAQSVRSAALQRPVQAAGGECNS
mgnify:CR=1 FL=1